MPSVFEFYCSKLTCYHRLSFRNLRNLRLSCHCPEIIMDHHHHSWTTSRTTAATHRPSGGRTAAEQVRNPLRNNLTAGTACSIREGNGIERKASAGINMPERMARMIEVDLIFCPPIALCRRRALSRAFRIPAAPRRFQLGIAIKSLYNKRCDDNRMKYINKIDSLHHTATPIRPRMKVFQKKSI